MANIEVVKIRRVRSHAPGGFQDAVESHGYAVCLHFACVLHLKAFVKLQSREFRSREFRSREHRQRELTVENRLTRGAMPSDAFRARDGAFRVWVRVERLRRHPVCFLSVRCLGTRAVGALIDPGDVILSRWDGRGHGGTYNCIKQARPVYIGMNPVR